VILLNDIRHAVVSEGMLWTDPIWTGAAWKWDLCGFRRYEVENPPSKGWPEDRYEQVDGATILIRPSRSSLQISPNLAVFDSWSVVPYIAARQPRESWVEGDQITLAWILSAWRCALGLTDNMPLDLKKWDRT